MRVQRLRNASHFPLALTNFLDSAAWRPCWRYELSSNSIGYVPVVLKSPICHGQLT
jgi:hypothetical protein